MYTGQVFVKYERAEEYGINKDFTTLDGVLSSNEGQLYDYLQSIKLD